MSVSHLPRLRRACRAAVLAALGFGMTAAGAEEAPTRIGADDPAASAASPAYGSPLQGFRRFAVEPPEDWRRVNDGVGAAGGYGGAMKEAPGADRPIEPATPAPVSPGSAGHAGHH